LADDFVGLPPDSLVQAVEAAVRAVDKATLTRVAGQDAGPAFQPRALLALLTFWYARQVYASSEIASRVRADLRSRHVCDQAIPDARTLRRFRCENRNALDSCLKRVLWHLALEKISQGLITHASEASIAQEASRRIIMAMFTDSLELDNNAAPDTPLELGFIVANE
jgi:transposase